ncbi:DUF599 domain-containing protein [Vandammella animalimorsus]|uniref:DUF599 domain-containing protein n=1 Tax=Vandammella animalimorsus TaxID=2029117 RepID=A0A3M6RTB3_9BURK|nr:DUF599 domain-containing protein [Vandammella animalimorsus]RMX18537.1 DUF599 domain-containing protein [Vandammella animalimorsus]
MKTLSMLSGYDWLALACFLGVWWGYMGMTKYSRMRHRSLLAATNRYRRYWMKQATMRDPRMLDGLITQNLSSTPTFFSSTTIIVIGGLFALLGTTDKAAELMRAFPFAQPAPPEVFELKILLLISIFVYAFFRFSWSMRQYTFVALAIGGMPPVDEFKAGRFDPNYYAERAGKLVGRAAEAFNDGLRAYYFSFAALAWFFSPLALMAATALVVFILYSREFHSDVLKILAE